MNKDIDNWYKSIPTYNNQPPCSLENFSEKQQFIDKEFPPEVDSLVTDEIIKYLQYQIAIIKNDEDLKKRYEDRLKIANKLKSITHWERISKLFPDYELFPPELNSDVFKQNQIGDCYFVSIISLASNYGDLITKLFPISKNPFGYYEVILFLNGWKRVIIDDYIPIYNGKPITSLSRKYEKCIYNILLEKAWAKVNKNFYNIYYGIPSHSMTILTGFKGIHIKIPKEIGDLDRINIINEIENGIKTEGKLYGVNTEGHSYSLLDVHRYYNKYIVFQVRNPWGKIGEIYENLVKNKNHHLLQMFFKQIDKDNYERKDNIKGFIEEELKQEFSDYTLPDKSGIFYISSKYFFDFFSGYDICYSLFDSTVIEYSIKFKDKDVNKRYFYFQMNVKETSRIQINLSTEVIDNFGKRYHDYFNPNIKIINVSNNKEEEYNRAITIKEKGHYIIKWIYTCPKYNPFKKEAPEDEILFWVPFEGNIELSLLGSSIKEKPKNNNYILTGFTLDRNIYKLNEKLGEYYSRKKNLNNLINNIYNIKPELDNKGFSICYRQDECTFSAFIIDENNPKKIFSLSQNNEYPEYIFTGENSYKGRIIGGSTVYCFDGKNFDKVYFGEINHNTFPQYDVKNKDKNKDKIRIKALENRLELTGETLARVTFEKLGRYEGQEKIRSHPHNLTYLITERNYVKCDICRNQLKKGSYYCSLCNFDYCGEKRNCVVGKNGVLEKNPHIIQLIDSLQHDHCLIKAKLLYPYKIFKCFSCLKEISQEEKVYYCTSCDFKICENCKIIEKRGEPWQFHSCWHEHPLTLCKTYGRDNYDKDSWFDIFHDDETKNVITMLPMLPMILSSNYGSMTKTVTLDEHTKEEQEWKGFHVKKPEFKIEPSTVEYSKTANNYPKNNHKIEYEYFFMCNHCGKKISRRHYSYYCTACDFYICIKCYKDYFFYIGRDKENIINLNIGNQKVSSSKCLCFFPKSIKNIKCQICEVFLELTEYNYYCSNCNSFFCLNCYRSHNIIFEENTLIYDGNFISGEKNGYGIVYKRNNEENYRGYWINGKYDLIKDIPHEHKNYYHKEFEKDCKCDICLKTCNKYDTGIFCYDCNMNICEMCVIEINKKTLKRADHECQLSIMKFETEKYCSVCEKKKNNIFFICNICNKKKHFIFTFLDKEYYCCVRCFGINTYNKYM